MFLFYEVLLKILGICSVLSIYYAILMTIVTYVLSDVDVKVKTIPRSMNTKKSLLIDIDSKVYMIKLEFRSSSPIHILINISGFLIPLIISIVLLLHELTVLNIRYVILLILMTIYQLITYSRLAVMRGDYIGLPLVKVLTISSTLGIVSSMVTNSPEVGFTLSFISTYLALLLGMDLIHINEVFIYSPKVVIIGGGGEVDALLVLPMISSLITYHTSLVLT